MALSPLEHFQMHQVAQVDLFGANLPFTNQAAWTMGTMAIVCSLLFLGLRKRALVPSRGQAAAEMVVEFVQDMVVSIIGREGMKFFPLIFTVFVFIAASNLAGMIPTSYPATAQISITGSIAIMVFILVWVVGLARHGLHFLSFFVPEGTPLVLLPLLVPLELISFFARPFTLALRLMANMLAGHVLMEVFAGFAVMMVTALGLTGILASLIPEGVLFAVTCLELFVALLQAYIFAVLTCVYLNDAVNMH